MSDYEKLQWMCNIPSKNTCLYMIVTCLLVRLPLCFTSSCEQVAVPLCSEMPWNLTKMPNLLHHSSQINAELVLSQYEESLRIADTTCRQKLLFFLCAMYVPVCYQREENYADIIQPCRSACEDARRHCEAGMIARYNYTWPKPCHLLPEYHKAMCVTPDAFIHAPATVECNCPAAGKPTKSNYMRRSLDYAIHARVVSTDTGTDGSFARVLVKSVLKTTTVAIEPGSINLHYSSNCVCPKLRSRKDYLIMGSDQSTSGRLMLDENSIVSKWKKKWIKKVQQWENKLIRLRRKSQKRGRKSRGRKKSSSN